MATNTTATLSAEMIQYLEEKFLERSEARTIHLEGAKKKTLGKTLVQQLPLQNDHHLAWLQRH